MDRGSVWYSCVTAARSVDAFGPRCRAGIQAKLVYGRNASHTRSWIFDASVCHINLTQCNLSSWCVLYVPSLLLLLCISGCKRWQQWTRCDLCLYVKLHHLQWLTLKPFMQVLRFHPTVWDHKVNNLAGEASEGIYKQRVCIYTGLLKFQCGKRKGAEWERTDEVFSIFKNMPMNPKKMGRGSTAAFKVLAENPNGGYSVLPGNLVKDGAQAAQIILP